MPMKWKPTKAKLCFKQWQEGMTTIEYIVILTLVAILIAFTSPGISDALLRVFRK